MKISVDQMYRIENAGHDLGFHKQYMMENAGAAAVRRLLERVGDVVSKSILVLAGMGNNGGDGLVMARHLAGYGAQVYVVLMGKPENIRTVECKANYAILQKMPSVTILPALDVSLVYDILVDALLGTGISGDIREPYSTAIAYINKSDSFKIAVDVPSGLDPDNGSVANIHASAHMTVTFHRMKRGMTGHSEITGPIHVERIGIPPDVEDDIL